MCSLNVAKYNLAQVNHETMLDSSRSLGTGAGWPGAIPRRPYVFYSSALDVKSFQVCFYYQIVLTEFIHSFISFFLFAVRGAYFSVMGSHTTNNSLQTAPVMPTPLTSEDDALNAPLTSHSSGLPSTSKAMDSSGEARISHAIASLITQTVQAALAAERANYFSSLLAPTAPIPSVSCPLVLSTMVIVCLRGVPPSHSSSTNTFFYRWCWSCQALGTKVGLLCLLLL